MNYRVEGPIVLPTKHGEFSLLSFTTATNIHTEITHSVIYLGNEFSVDEPVALRVHSSCRFSESFGSVDCDCADQLHKAFRLISEIGKGMVIYLEQEGRGVGLECKVKAIKLEQETDVDTFVAFEKLGWQPDMREYSIVSIILKHFGIDTVKLFTNSPQKVNSLQGMGIKVVEQIPLIVDKISPHAYGELRAKKEKMGHQLDFLDNLEFDTQ